MRHRTSRAQSGGLVAPRSLADAEVFLGEEGVEADAGVFDVLAGAFLAVDGGDDGQDNGAGGAEGGGGLEGGAAGGGDIFDDDGAVAGVEGALDLFSVP